MNRTGQVISRLLYDGISEGFATASYSSLMCNNSRSYCSYIDSVKAFANKIYYIILYSVFILHRYWMNSDTDDSYLGGLNTTDLLFNWHPVLMVAGMILCLTSAVVSYRILPLTHNSSKYIHSALHTLAVICIILGISAVVECTEPTFFNIISHFTID